MFVVAAARRRCGRASAVVAVLYPHVAAVADDVVVPHEAARPRVTVTDQPTVLFVCVHNAGRSQMAAGWLRHLAGDARRGPLGRLEPGRPDQPGRRRGDGRGRHRHHRPARRSCSTDRRRRGLRRRHHHGLRRRLPVLPRQALRGLGARRPGRPGRRRRSARSATRSSAASAPSSPSSPPPPRSRVRVRQRDGRARRHAGAPRRRPARRSAATTTRRGEGVERGLGHGRPVPSTATNTAIPSTAPIWRLMLTTALPVADRCRREIGRRGRQDGRQREPDPGAADQHRRAGRRSRTTVRAVSRNPQSGIPRRRTSSAAGRGDPCRPTASATGAGRPRRRSAPSPARRRCTAGAHRRVAPDLLHPEDAGSRFAGERHAEHDRGDVGEGEAPHPQQRRLHDRRRVVRASATRTTPSPDRGDREGDAATDRARPAPVRALHQAEGEGADRDGEDAGAEQVRHGRPLARGRRARSAPPDAARPDRWGR